MSDYNVHFSRWNKKAIHCIILKLASILMTVNVNSEKKIAKKFWWLWSFVKTSLSVTFIGKTLPYVTEGYDRVVKCGKVLVNVVLDISGNLSLTASQLLSIKLLENSAIPEQMHISTC